MSHEISQSGRNSTRKPIGAPLDPGPLAELRARIVEHGARRLVMQLGVSLPAVERAASGGNVLRGTARLILDGLEKLRGDGDGGTP